MKALPTVLCAFRLILQLVYGHIVVKHVVLENTKQLVDTRAP